MKTEYPATSQNLAKHRAEHFGQDNLHHSAKLRTSSSSVVVTTTAADLVAPDHGPVTADDEHELRTKPRGFFADQFEVRLHLFEIEYHRLTYDRCGGVE